MLARAISPAESLAADALPRIVAAARTHLASCLGFEPSPAHLDDIVQDLVAIDPSTLAAYIAHPHASPDDAGLNGIVRAALDLRRKARPYLFQPLCSRTAFLKTAAAERLGTAEPSEKQSRAVANEWDLSGVDGVEGLRRTHTARCERLHAAHKRELIARDGHTRGAGLFTDPNDPREAAARGVPGTSAVSGIPTVSASRSQLPTRGVIAGGPPPKVPMTQLFDTNGKLQSIPVAKAGDYVLLRGWRRPIDVVKGTAPAPAEGADVEDAEAALPPLAPTTATHAQTLGKLTALREEAAALGIDWSAGWGIARLRGAIEAAGAATAATSASPDGSNQPAQE